MNFENENNFKLKNWKNITKTLDKVETRDTNSVQQLNMFYRRCGVAFFFIALTRCLCVFGCLYAHRTHQQLCIHFLCCHFDYAFLLGRCCYCFNMEYLAVQSSLLLLSLFFFCFQNNFYYIGLVGLCVYLLLLW